MSRAQALSVIRWLQDHHCPPRMLDIVARHLTESPPARWKQISFARDTLRVRLQDRAPGRRITLKDLVDAAEEDRIDAIEL